MKNYHRNNHKRNKDYISIQHLFDVLHEMVHPELNLTTGTYWDINYRLDQEQVVNKAKINARTSGDAIEELRNENEDKKLIILSILPASKK